MWNYEEGKAVAHLNVSSRLQWGKESKQNLEQRVSKPIFLTDPTGIHRALCRDPL